MIHRLVNIDPQAFKQELTGAEIAGMYTIIANAFEDIGNITSALHVINMDDYQAINSQNKTI